MKQIKITTACGVYFNDSLLMIKEKQDGREVIDIPAGGLDANETIVQGVIREVSEEAGVVIENPVLKGIFQIITPDQTTINFLFTETLDELPVLNSFKSIIDEGISDVMFVPLEEIKKKTLTNPELFEHSLALRRLEFLLTKDVSSNRLFTTVL